VRARQRGVSLVELSVVVTITGVLATLATYSVRERVNEAHSVEAISMLGNIRTAVLAKSNDLTGSSANVLEIGGRVGGFGGPLGLPGVLGGVGDKTGDSDGDGNKGHGNNEGGCDPDNPGNSGKDCNGNGSDGNSGNGNGNGNGNNGGGDQSGGDGEDDDKGHGNNDGGCDPDNPGNGGKNCGGGDSSADDGADGSGGDAATEEDVPLCGSASPVPSTLEAVKGSVYQSRTSDWSGSAAGGWSCLHVSMSQAQRFQYGYDVGATGAPTSEAPSGADERFTAWARGDLDGDGRNSWFVLSGAALGDQLVMAPAVTIIDQGE